MDFLVQKKKIILDFFELMILWNCIGILTPNNCKYKPGGLKKTYLYNAGEH